MGVFFRSFVQVVVWVRKVVWLADEKIGEWRAKRAASKAAASADGPRSGEPVRPDYVAQLRARAEQQTVELGPRPRNPHEETVWEDEWRGAAVLLAALGRWDRARLRLAAVSESGAARQLLLDAADECAEADRLTEP
jgi:hypothetical protein